jgi:hypothetical protein
MGEGLFIFADLPGFYVFLTISGISQLAAILNI